MRSKISNLLHLRYFKSDMRKQQHPYIELTKPGIVIMVLVTSALGFILGSAGSPQLSLLLWTLFGTALSAGGSTALNHYLERDLDALMKRTQNRPLVTGAVSPQAARAYGLILLVSGLLVLYVATNWLTAALSAATAFLYLCVYTPLKRVTSWNTFVGAIPGAIPPVGGWVAATGSMDLEAWFLFAILFVWQHPHFFAIAWLCRDDYARAGFRMLPVIDTAEKNRTRKQTIFYSCLLLPISILPATAGLFSSQIYLLGATAFSVMMLMGGMYFSQNQSRESARALLFSSLIYLPALFLCIIVDLFLTQGVPTFHL